MKKVLTIFALLLVLAGCSNNGDYVTTVFKNKIFIPNRESNYSDELNGKDMDTIIYFNLSKEELESIEKDISENNNWNEFDKESYQKIIGDDEYQNAYLQFRRIGYLECYEDIAVIEPFNFQKSYYCIYDNKQKKIIKDFDSISTDWWLSFAIFDSENGVLYFSEQSI